MTGPTLVVIVAISPAGVALATRTITFDSGVIDWEVIKLAERGFYAALDAVRITIDIAYQYDNSKL